MKDIIISIYKELRDSDTITQGYRVVENVENNPFFPDPPAALAATKKLLPELQSAVSNAKGRDMIAICLKNDKKAELIALLTELAEYVTSKSQGNRLMLLSSGFPISGARNTQIDQVIQKFEVEIGAPGEATTKVKRLRGARVYMHQYTTGLPTSETEWHSEISKHPYYTYSGLNSMEKYLFRVIVINHEGETITSPVITRVIQ